MQGYFVSVPAQSLHQRLYLDAIKIGFVIFCLVRNDDIKIGEGLAE